MKLTKQQIKDIVRELNIFINIPKIPELIEGWLLRIVVTIIDFWLYKKLPEPVYDMYKDLVLMLIEGNEQEKAEAKEEIIALVPSEFLKAA